MRFYNRLLTVFTFSVFQLHSASAQQPIVNARIAATQIAVGDQVKLFIEASHAPAQGRLQWANIPDTFNSLEIVEKGKIDTTKQGDVITYKQRLLITGFDSGIFKVPAFAFSVIPNSGTPYILQTDSFQVLVQTLPVDTTKPFIGIKEIIAVKSSWRDYIWLIIGGLIFIGLAIFVFIYFFKNKKTPMPATVPKGPVETLQEKTLRLLNELESRQLWQSDRVKEYYIELSDILRSYIEERFRTPALELTTREFLKSIKKHPEMSRQYNQLSFILNTSDLAKFAKAQPLPHEHEHSMEMTREFIIATTPAITENTAQPT